MITSCDAYADCWKPMIFSLDKYWPDCEWPRYIVTNYKEDNSLPNTNFIKVGDDHRSWCNLARMGMEAIDADYILFFQEDYWLAHPVNNEAIKAHVKYMDENHVDYLKITHDMVRDDLRIDASDYCLNPIDRRYAFNTAKAFWRKDVIINLLPQDWNGWQFERQITQYFKDNNIKINSQILYSPLIPEKGLVNIQGGAIVRGVWTHAAVDFLKENGMSDIIEKRKIMGPVTTRLYALSRYRILRPLCWGVLKILKNHKVNW